MQILVQREYKTKYGWVGNMMHWELCKKLKFDHTNMRYMHNLSWRMRRIKFSGILWLKQIAKSRPDDQI